MFTILVWQLFSFSTLKISFHWFLFPIIVAERTVNGLIPLFSFSYMPIMIVEHFSCCIINIMYLGLKTAHMYFLQFPQLGDWPWMSWSSAQGLANLFNGQWICNLSHSLAAASKLCDRWKNLVPCGCRAEAEIALCLWVVTSFQFLEIAHIYIYIYICPRTSLKFSYNWAPHFFNDIPVVSFVAACLGRFFSFTFYDFNYIYHWDRLW